MSANTFIKEFTSLKIINLFQIKGSLEHDNLRVSNLGVALTYKRATQPLLSNYFTFVCSVRGKRWEGVHVAPRKDSTGEPGLPQKTKY